MDTFAFNLSPTRREILALPLLLRLETRGAILEAELLLAVLALCLLPSLLLKVIPTI
jgi:hypothetical protein